MGLPRNLRLPGALPNESLIEYYTARREVDRDPSLWEGWKRGAKKGAKAGAVLGTGLYALGGGPPNGRDRLPRYAVAAGASAGLGGVVGGAFGEYDAWHKKMDEWKTRRSGIRSKRNSRRSKRSKRNSRRNKRSKR
tara:strand:- start:64 stop:471 length:408 start_codon:yes stop_codon:yes gene_type:complete